MKFIRLILVFSAGVLSFFLPWIFDGPGMAAVYVCLIFAILLYLPVYCFFRKHETATYADGFSVGVVTFSRPLTAEEKELADRVVPILIFSMPWSLVVYGALFGVLGSSTSSHTWSSGEFFLTGASFVVSLFMLRGTIIAGDSGEINCGERPVFITKGTGFFRLGTEDFGNGKARLMGLWTMDRAGLDWIRSG